MSVLIRPAEESDARPLVQLRRRLFAETAFMLWEPGEFTATAEDELLFIKRLASRPNSRLLLATSDAEVVGFLAAIGGERNRLRHSALLALGVIRERWSEGIASRMLADVIAWAPSAGVKRLELMVHTTNAKAIAVYRRLGFEVEGTRKCSLLVDGEYVDEYCMSHITGV